MQLLSDGRSVYQTEGAIAISATPQRKSTIVTVSRIRARKSEWANSFQASTPHSAATIAAPWAMAVEAAGPTCAGPSADAATHIAIAPAHHTTPPARPDRWRARVPCLM